MILELDTSLFDIYGEMSINQLVFLTLVLNENQSNNQDIHQFLSRISENEIQELVDSNIITVITSGDSKIYSISEDTRKHLKQDKSWFDEFYEVFPVYVTRPDGTKGFLRSNINKCRKEYNRIIGKSRAMHEHLIKCLQFEIDNKMITGKIGYMKTMWKWLTQREWEVTEEEMQFSMEQDINNEVAYGANII
jgi:hypothetical protein